MADIESRFPYGIDEHLMVPLTPRVARLSEPEAPQDELNPDARNVNGHTDLHAAVNNSIRQIERHTLVDDAVNTHDHSDEWNIDYSQEPWLSNPSLKRGRRLLVQNTHVFMDRTHANDTQATAPDTDLAGIHHSLSATDTGGDFQAASMQLWRRKNLQDVPDAMFDGLNNLSTDWDASVTPYPGDSLESVITTLLAEIRSLKERVSTLESQVSTLTARTDRTFSDILGKVWGGPVRAEDGGVTWGMASQMRIPMGDLNIFTDDEPNSETVTNAIRSRDQVADSDIKAN